MLPAGSADTIIVRPSSCIRRSTPTFFTPADVQPESHAARSCLRWCPTSASTWPSTRARLTGARCRSSATAPSGTASSARRPGAEVEFLGWLTRRGRARRLSPGGRRDAARARRTSASCRSRRRPADARSSPGARRRARDGHRRRHRRAGSGLRRARPFADAALARVQRDCPSTRAIRALTPSSFAARAFATRDCGRVIDDTVAAPAGARDGKTLQPSAGRLLRRRRRGARHVRRSCSRTSSASRAA